MKKEQIIDVSVPVDAVSLKELCDSINADVIRKMCAAHITTYYPEWKQINILRAGTKAQKDQMTAFIDACRTWSNAEKPNPADLAAIQP